MEQRKPPATAGLGPGDVATKLGVTPKALRVYERAGLLTPERRAGGWRRYTREDLARLHQILALKGLGLSLRQIGEVLAGDGADLIQTLGLQSRHLENQIAALRQRLDAVTHARQRLAAGEPLSVDELINLARQATAPQTLTTDDVRRLLIELVESRGLEPEIARLRLSMAERLKGTGVDLPTLRHRISQALTTAERLRQANHTAASPAVRDLAREWREIVALVGEANGEALSATFGTDMRQLAQDFQTASPLSAAFTFLTEALATTPPKTLPGEKA
ncbi:MerR family transcriptional regulator [Nitrospirillum viridazoti]|uniref:DNA-binding transcriptional MerR regulator n=1 Tax=Nitrospirillum amazonense TaxID=28077 RepID=A0A560IXA1_9PROT|nr:MerR family transcriptional regulator [Nitrospirillum amazonense]TWB63628.1 DNA-binding transcriptional MerR regulator [Nitrospirillum amazonense]